MKRRGWIDDLTLFEVMGEPYFAVITSPTAGPHGVAYVEMLSERTWQGYMVPSPESGVLLYESSGELGELVGRFMLVHQAFCAMARMSQAWRDAQAKVDENLVALYAAQQARVNEIRLIAMEVENELC